MKILVLKITMILSLSFISLSLFADPPGMPGNHGSNGDQPPGGGAPIGGGAFILIGLSAAFGANKIYKIKQGV